MDKATTHEKSPEVEICDAKELVLGNANNLNKDADLHQILEVHATLEEQRKVLMKIDLLMIPLMGFCYMLQYMDKLAISQATLLGLRQDLSLQGDQYSWSSAIFYFGYLAWSLPVSYLIVRFPLGKYLGVSVFFWGGILMCHAAVKGFAGLMTVRFFLGIGEAAIAPGFAMLTGMFYTRKEQPLRQAAWFLGNAIANVIGGVVAYGIGKISISSGLEHWKLLFIILGSVTSAYSLILIAFLPDSPLNALFLTRKERMIAVQRTLSNKVGVMDEGRFLWNQAWLALRDPQTLFLVLYTFSINLCNGGLTSFGGIIIAGFGFSDFKALLLQMPLGATQVVFLILTSGFATFVPSTRIAIMIFNCTVSLIGYLLIYKLGPDAQAGKMAGLCLGTAFATNIPLSLSLISSNVAGFTKKSVVSAALFAAYCVGNIAGPQFFLASQEPTYITGMTACLAGAAFGIFFLICLLLYYIWENRRRDALYGKPNELSTGEELQDELANITDTELHSFRYVL
ncbi:hypothetical protein B7463_g8822, partial [Scytalidium lignicola]